MSDECAACGQPMPSRREQIAAMEKRMVAMTEVIAAAEERGRRSVFADPEALARRFHETYERLAPEHGYETRKDSAVPWEKVPEKNRRLMVAVCAALAPRVPHASEDPPCAGCGHVKWRHQYGSKEHAFCSEPIGRDYCQCKNYLAPRDSAPAIPSVASQGCHECSKPQPGDLGMGSIEARQLRCPHGKYTPRDSGKEG